MTRFPTCPPDTMVGLFRSGFPYQDWITAPAGQSWDFRQAIFVHVRARAREEPMFALTCGVPDRWKQVVRSLRER